MVISSQAQQVRILRLVDGQHNDGVLYRLQKQWVLHFMLGSTLPSRNITIYTNAPEDGKSFERYKYRELEWNVSSKLSGDKLDDFAPLTLHMSGSFQYYFEYDGIKAGSGYLIVDPTLTVGSNNRVLPLDAVCMQTVMPKLLGKFNSWKDRLRVGRESGYNVFHFTPVQELGISRSAYSIADQLALNSNFSEDSSKPVTMKDMKNFVKELRSDWNMLCVTDVVWNHTAKNSSWLKTNPECAYNLFNSPYLRPAYVLDRAVFHLSLEIQNGKYDKKFKQRNISTSSDIETLKEILEVDVIPPLKLHEFFQVDIDKEVEKFKKALSTNTTSNEEILETIDIIQDAKYTRFGCTVDTEVAVSQFSEITNPNVDDIVQAFEDTIIWLNKTKEEELAKDMEAAVANILSTVRYERLDSNGPKHESITASCPLVTTYFNHPFPNTSPAEEEIQIMEDVTNCNLIMAYNGWVMGANALENFADSPGSVYFRRELICWGDSVKLRYGSEPSDCPALWDRMKKYTEATAQVFHGIRIDNCHSTPIHVAEYMLDAARKIQPDIYVFAELFTGSEHIDNIFVNRLGLTSLIREALNAWDANELGRLVYLYGGESIASFMQPVSQDLKPSRAHALFYDITHDNESMITKRSIHDLVPSSALVAMSSCAIGSNRGHDEMTPHHIHVVKEERLYRKWIDNAETSAECVGSRTAMVKVKNVLNRLHQSLAVNGFDQVFVDQRTPDVVAVTRHNPRNHHSYLMIAYTSFKDMQKAEIPPLAVEGVISRITLEAKPKLGEKLTSNFLQSFVKNKQYINGIDDYEVYVQSDLPIDKSTCCTITGDKDEKKTITFTNFTPGSVLVLSVAMVPTADAATSNIRKLIMSLSNNEESEFDKVIENLDLRALNRVLFHCDAEERSDGFDIGAYDIPNFGTLSYCGIAGIAVQMAKIRSKNDLGHPVCSNLREGNWLLDYLSSRLSIHQETTQLGQWYDKVFKVLSKVPRFLIPAYFEMIMTLTYDKLLKICWSKMSSFIKNGSNFVKRLSLGTVAMCGYIKGANLPVVHPDVKGLVQCPDDPSSQICLSMAAGLPHFSAGVMRCWGRDTFIAMHGLQMVTGQFVDARILILAFAGCVRHGLIPNLLGEGKISRYNCRDAVWFWLQCIQELCYLDGYDLLQVPVARIFPKDSSQPTKVGEVTQPLCDVIQEVMQKHVDGIKFRERNAGPQIDMNMSGEGFNVTAGINHETGFVYGGSKHNCGTWMDKMGESEKAGTKGVPATPRDGSAIELVGLCKSTVSWLEEAFSKKKYPYDGVTPRRGTKLTWAEWSKKIEDNFEKYFYVSDHDESNLVHKRNIYKDTVGASQNWCDYQLRPNFSIAMVYAPELFEPSHAWKALEIAQEKLLGPLGMKTLDPDDMQYCGDYDNGNDSEDASVAKGFNYHQGPEWLWPVGYFLRAKLHFAKLLGPEKLEETTCFIQNYLVKHQLHLEESDWCGLPELTNSDGSFCKDSCPIQAWSHGTLLDLLYDMSKLTAEGC